MNTAILSCSASSAETYRPNGQPSLTTTRREHALAVIALLPEALDQPAQRQNLMGCLFSRELAPKLTETLGFVPATEAADDLVDFLIGRLISTLSLPPSGQQRDRAATSQSIEQLLQSHGQ